MDIQKSRVVSFHYQLKDHDGTVLSASQDQPLTYMHGTGAIIPGLEKELTGRAVGDELSVEVAPEEGYGVPDPKLIAVLKKEAFQGIDSVEPGMQFQAADDKGNVQVITVTAVNGDEVTVDRNHPLAGKTLFFQVRIEEVREATEEELQQARL